MPNEKETAAQVLKERFALLPKVVQDAITSADVEKQLRTLADSHKLHIDQWSALENEVMMTLMGLEEMSNLETNLQNEVGIAAEEASSLAKDISQIVFEPIRQELERGLSHPEAKEKAVTTEEIARDQAIASEAPTQTESIPAEITPVNIPAETTPVSSAPPAPPVLPATPPAPKPTEKAVRAPISSSYTSQQASTARKGVEGDPYRELPK